MSCEAESMKLIFPVSQAADVGRRPMLRTTINSLNPAAAAAPASAAAAGALNTSLGI